MALSVVLLALALASVASAAPEQRIVGGEPTTIENYPYIVSLTYHYPAAGITVQRCVGCLLSSWHVLTSGFCFTGAIEENFLLRAGTSNSLTGGTAVTLNGVIKHPDYRETPRIGDMAVCFMSVPMGMSNTINVLYLPPQGTYIPDGTETKVISWGFEYIGGPQLELLKTINLFKMGVDECRDIYADKEDAPVINEKVICASAVGKGMCTGDSGAPMVIGQTAVGISSYFGACADEDVPEVFTRVDPYTEWILSVATAPSA